jgi:hypothetical protein
MAFYWQIFDNGPEVALVGREATRFASWHTIRTLIGARNDAAFVPDETTLPGQIVAGQQYPVALVFASAFRLTSCDRSYVLRF